MQIPWVDWRDEGADRGGWKGTAKTKGYLSGCMETQYNRSLLKCLSG